jgi:hypothetical protein
MSKFTFPKPDIRNIPRDSRRLEIERRVRLKHGLQLIRNDADRNKFLFLVWAEMNPGTWIASAVREALYVDPDTFAKLDMHSADTLLRDNRSLEEEGFFEKVTA